MARVQTGHIHLGSSILHHTEGWETKSLKKKTKKKTKNGRNTQKDSFKHTCMHALHPNTQTKKRSSTTPPPL